MRIDVYDLEGHEELLSSPNASMLPHAKFLLLRRHIMAGLYGIKPVFNWTLDFNAYANRWDSTVHLTKSITGFEIYNKKKEKLDFVPDDLSEVVETVTVYLGHYRVHFKPADKNKNTAESYSVKEFIYNYNSGTKKHVEFALMERVHSALFLVQQAKSDGITKVNFNGTTDAVERYCLQLACKKLGMDCSGEKIDLSELPKNPALNNVPMKLAIERTFDFIEKDPMKDIDIPAEEIVKQQRAAASKTATRNTADDDLEEVLAGRAKKDFSRATEETDAPFKNNNQDDDDDLDDMDAALASRANNQSNPDSPRPTA